MVIRRAEIYWADVGPPSGSRPGKCRPVLVIQADPYNASRLATVLAAVITSNTALATMPGNVFLPATVTRLPRDSVVNITAVVTRNKTDLTDPTAASTSRRHSVDRRSASACWSLSVANSTTADRPLSGSSERIPALRGLKIGCTAVIFGRASRSLANH